MQEEAEEVKPVDVMIIALLLPFTPIFYAVGRIKLERAKRA